MRLAEERGTAQGNSPLIKLKKPLAKLIPLHGYFSSPFARQVGIASQQAVTETEENNRIFLLDIFPEFIFLLQIFFNSGIDQHDR